jgi:hypothetical protein
MLPNQLISLVSHNIMPLSYFFYDSNAYILKTSSVRRNRELKKSDISPVDFAFGDLFRNWFRAFLSNNPLLKIGTAAPIEARRHKNATTQILRSWFDDLLIPLVREYNYPAHMIANCDETMVQIKTPQKCHLSFRD